MTRLAVLSALALAAAAGPALADLSADDLWQSWQDLASLHGATLVAGAVEDTGSGLRLRDLDLTVTVMKSATVKATFPDLTLTETGGKVAILYPEAIALDAAVTDPNGITTTATGQTRLTGAEVVAEDDGGVIAYAFDIDAMTTALRSEMPVPVEAGGGQMVSTTDLVLSAIAGTARQMTGADLGRWSKVYSIQTVTARTVDTGPMPGMRATSDSVIETVTGSGSGDFTGGVFRTVELTNRFGSQRQSAEQSGPGGNFSFVSQAGAGTTTVAASPAGAEMSVSGTDAILDVTVAALPAPLHFELGTVSFDGRVPFDLSGGPQDFAAAVTLDGLRAGDSVWALFDPMNHIDHGPGRLSFDVTGSVDKAPVLSPLPPEMRPPFNFRQVTLNRLDLVAGGAHLQGKGAVDIAPDANGLPDPVGKLSLSVVNGLALLQGLGAAGIIPQDQMMGVQMMLGAMTRPEGDGDRLVTEIEFLGNQQVTVNGIQVR